MQPNVVLINCDDLGWGDLSCFGSKMNHTPILDNLASEGMRFTNFYAAAPTCSPSRASMLTGCYPQRIGLDRVLFPGDNIGLNPKEETLAKLLKRSGYHTALIGKWHCGDQEEFLPRKHGFDYYYGLPYSNDMGRQKDRLPNKMNPRPPLPLMENEYIQEEQPDQASLTYRYIDRALSFIEEKKDERFFLYLAHMYVHVPLYVPDYFLKNADNPYQAAVSLIDWSTGVLLKKLEDLGLMENTLLIFTSDNGSRCDYDTSNGYLRGEKGTTWEGGQRVPCIIKWADKIKRDSVSDSLTNMMDFLPTIANICGIDLPKEKIDGKDLAPILFKSENTEVRDCFAYYSKKELRAIRMKHWKLHFFKVDKVRLNPRTCLELYNLEEDPSETNNLINSREDIKQEMIKLADEIRKKLGDSLQSIKGEECREVGKVENPKTLTSYDESHPYFMAEYDLSETG